MINFTSIGDCVVDYYPQLNKAFLGGSAFNVCVASQKFQVKTTIISAVGNDLWAKKYYSTCSELKINSRFLASFSGKTSHVAITLDKSSSPYFSQWQLGALKKFRLNPRHEKFLASQTITHCTAIKPLKLILQQFCQIPLPGVFKSADFDGNTPYTIPLPDIPRYTFGLNLIAKSLNLNNKQQINFLKRLAKTQRKIVLITLGTHGSWVFTKDKDYFQPAVVTEVVDTTGAGDTYLAAFIINYLQTKDIQKAMFLATQAAVEKITRFGASS